VQNKKMNIFIKDLQKEFEKKKDLIIAKEQSSYMKKLFPFLGLKKPIRTEIEKKMLKKYIILNEDDLYSTVKILFDMEYREYQYTACVLAYKYKKLFTEKSFFLLEYMIRNKSWWDTVDIVATKLLGFLLEKFPKLRNNMDLWINDKNLWIKRSVLLFQLKYKNKTSEKKLFEYCEKTINEKDFFIRKAIGWSLREYSKTNKKSVRDFIEKNKNYLSKLSIKEGSKYLI